jgi:hypothetical protein
VSIPLSLQEFLHLGEKASKYPTQPIAAMQYSSVDLGSIFTILLRPRRTQHSLSGDNMKKLQRHWMVGLFILVLATTTFAGDIHTGSPQPPTDQPPTIAPANTQGSASPATNETIVDTALNLLQVMLSVF